MKPEIGFVGLGVMGRPMASHLSRKYSVIAFDVDRSRLEGLTGVEAAGRPSEVCEADVVLLSLPSTHAVETVVLGGMDGR
ncbi:MAG: NAD(P)-binding domain-containing protein [Halomonas sp.]|uniref:NAD(P)-binding domain-containing protein n=1 Tax=Halomonas sp. TaxID=1486246 RepID=UPI002ACE398B|nr:NAD(P)-binding domain-containing protein [Halomonas sp.]MDZ7852617.1 NAD(P)-binding domain-containing protein [Halomonas sp.]